MHPDPRNASRMVNDCMTQSGNCSGCFWHEFEGPGQCVSSGDRGMPLPLARELWSQLATAKGGLAQRMMVRPLGGRSCAEPDACVGVTVATGDCVCYSDESTSSRLDAPMKSDDVPPAGRGCISVKPSATNKAVRDFGKSVHYVCKPAGPPLHKLFIMIPGIQPEVYHWPVELGASVGYHSLGISWFDKPAAGGVCFESAWATRTGQTDAQNATQVMATCAYQVMLMRLLGSDDPRVPPNPANFSVDSLNSIVGRAEALLKYLVGRGQPEWAEYLDSSGKLRWEKVAVAGHSRASGIVAALSKVPSIADNVQRMIMVGGPGDCAGNVSNVTHPSLPGGGGYWRPDWVVDLPSNSSHLYSLDPAYRHRRFICVDPGQASTV